MKYDLRADDVFEMAEEIERNGAKFYRDAADATQEASSKDFLLKLAEMEDDHETTFKSLRQNLTEADKSSTVFDPDNESVLYLRALADARVFFEKKIPDLTSLTDILKSAIEAEKDSIVFYLGMREAVPDKYGKQRLDDIIKEEMAHIRLLSKELVALNN